MIVGLPTPDHFNLKLGIPLTNSGAGLICLGRQGLFTHDNIHHTMMMAEKAAQCIGPAGVWDGKKWEMYCEEFSEYVVED